MLVRLLCLLTLVLAGCAQTPKTTLEVPESDQPTYWSYSRVVQTRQSMVTLFDPNDLTHHQDDPPDWYRFDYGFKDDLESGRFVATTLPYNGQVRVRITSSPLTQAEQQAAGPRATMRLRVRNGRLLLAGGDAWPSINQRASDLAYDPRFLAFHNGDYRVTLTVLDRTRKPEHDLIIQFKPVSDIVQVSHAPGFPHLYPGKAAAVTGLNAPGFRFNEQCAAVTHAAEWTPLITQQLPLPGTRSWLEVSNRISARGAALQTAGKPSAIPLVLSQNTSPGSVGIFLAPSDWSEQRPASGNQSYIKANFLCAVQITGTSPHRDKLLLKLRPLPGGLTPIPVPLAREIANRFAAWARFTNLPGWKFKGEQAQRATNHRSLITGVMSNLNLAPGDAATLLSLSADQRAIEVLNRMPVDW